MTIQVRETNDAEVAFGTDEGLPDYKTVPEEFKKYTTKWNKFCETLFYSGIGDLKLLPQKGVDPAMAWKHCQALLRSFGSKHEHKMAGVAYLMSQYFVDISYKDKAGKLVEFDVKFADKE